MAAIMPLLDLVELRVELRDTEDQIARMGERTIVDAGRWAERMEILDRWRNRIREQIAETEGADD